MKFSRDDVELLGEEVAFQGFFRIKTLTLKHQLFAGGWSPVITRELFERGDAVGVLLYDPHRDEIALVEQFRVGPYARGDAPWMTELVAGMVESGESTDEVAIREAEEEAGCVLEQLLPIARYYSSPGGCSEYISLFCGKAHTEGLRGNHGLDAEVEDIRVKVLPFEQAMQAMADGEFNNAHTMIALQWLALNKNAVLAQWL